MEFKPTKIPLPRYSGVDKDRFLLEIYPLRKPAVLQDLDLGVCKTQWTLDYMSNKGGEREVKVHVSETPQLDFIKKNFLYRSLPFDVFIHRAAEDKHKDFFISEGDSTIWRSNGATLGQQYRQPVERVMLDDEKYYLRSLGEDPRKDIADINKQFPELAADITIPEFFEKDQFFSSVFRISSLGLQLWTHYDVMDNLLIQVTGRKRVVLYSPRDAPFLYLSGDKSEVLDVDNPDLAKYPLFSQARRYECTLEAGDVLFIPALWFHNTVAEEFGVGVNVFWKHLPSECYDKTDTYGNKDPTAASRAMQILDRALKTLDELPEEYRDFYARRMVLRIQSKSYSTNFE